MVLSGRIWEWALRFGEGSKNLLFALKAISFPTFGDLVADFLGNLLVFFWVFVSFFGFSCFALFLTICLLFAVVWIFVGFYECQLYYKKKFITN